MKKIELIENSDWIELSLLRTKLNEVIAAVNDLMPQSVPVNKSSSAVWADAFDLPREPDARYTKQQRLEQLEVVVQACKRVARGSAYPDTEDPVLVYSRELSRLKEML